MGGVNVCGLLRGTSFEAIESIKFIESIESVKSSDSIEFKESTQSIEPNRCWRLKIIYKFHFFDLQMIRTWVPVKLWSWELEQTDPYEVPEPFRGVSRP